VRRPKRRMERREKSGKEAAEKERRQDKLAAARNKQAGVWRVWRGVIAWYLGVW
jgi:hypothetical protein